MSIDDFPAGAESGRGLLRRDGVEMGAMIAQAPALYTGGGVIDAGDVALKFLP